MPPHFCLALPSSAPFISGESSIHALVVVCRYLGDVLLATSLARSLNESGYTVDWLVAPGTQDLLHAQPFVNTVYTVSAATPWHKQLSLARRLWRKYDMSFVLTASDRPALLALAASSETYALIPAKGKQYAWKRFASSQWIPYEEKQHMVWRAMRLAKLAGLPACADVGIEWSDDDVQQVQRKLPWDKNEAYIQLHPFARWRYKWWNQNSWRTLINNILDTGMHVVITGSPAEQSQAQKLAEGYSDKQVSIQAGELSWQQLACLSSHAAAYIGLDTANTHLAASTGTPVIALFGPTDPRIWGPWPNGFDSASPWQARSEKGIQRCGNISLLQGIQACVPCQLEGCHQHPESDSECLQTMSPTYVWEEIQRRLPSSP